VINNNAELLAALASPVRKIGFRVYIFKDTDYVGSFDYKDRLISITVERSGDSSKFFGYGVSHKANIKLIDANRELNITTEHKLIITYDCNNTKDYFFTPFLYVSEVHRDEKTNELSITAYDLLYSINRYTIGDLGLEENYSPFGILVAIINKFGLPESLPIYGVDDISIFSNINGANFSGNENLREVLDDIAELIQCIYYINYDNELCFKRLSNNSDVNYTIEKSMYIDFDSGANRRLTTITHTTELGDNVTVTTGVSGSTQYIRSNPFLDLRDDIGDLMDAAIANVGGLTINQFELEWRGIPDIEIGDKIAIATKDGGYVYSYLLNDTLSYDGSLSQSTKWEYEEDEGESADNPTNLGDALKQTFARVDKANKQIDLVASESSANSDKIAALQINTEGISASVSDLEKSIEDANGNIVDILSKVEAVITPEEVELAIKKEIDNGVEKVITSTGFTFDEDGLTVSKSDSEMKTTITEDGMIVYKNDEAVLTANNIGVDATNLHATTYLIIGTNSRFEDYGDNRTGCFWIGG
jgi:hypothetical protein